MTAFQVEYVLRSTFRSHSFMAKQGLSFYKGI